MKILAHTHESHPNHNVEFSMTIPDGKDKYKVYVFNTGEDSDNPILASSFKIILHTYGDIYNYDLVKFSKQDYALLSAFVPGDNDDYYDTTFPRIKVTEDNIDDQVDQVLSVVKEDIAEFRKNRI